MKNALQLISLVLSLLGTYLIAKKKRSGWLIAFSAGLSWTILYVQSELYIAILAQIAFMVMYLFGWFKWKRK